MTDATHPGPRCRECGMAMELDRGICPACQAASWTETSPEHPLWGLLDAARPRNA